jgi:hypothetical protein
LQTRARLVPTALLALLALLALAACVPIDHLDTLIAGILRDTSGAPVAGAVVYLTRAAPPFAFVANGDTACPAPSRSHAGSTCTDAEGRFRLRVTSPPTGEVRLAFEADYRRAEASVDLDRRRAGHTLDLTVHFPEIEPAEELDRAVRYALPALRHFALVTLDDGPVLDALRAHTTATNARERPIHLELPIRQPDGSERAIRWTAYHHDLRADGVSDCSIDAVTLGDVDCVAVDGPSLTFQGMPWLDPIAIRAFIANPTAALQALQNEAAYQLSVIAIVGDELDATYYGNLLAWPHTPSSLQGLRSVLDLHLDPAAVDRLLAATPLNYLLHNQTDLAMNADDDHLDVIPNGIATDPGARSERFLTNGTQFLRPVMAADPTVYDAATGVYLVDHFYARADAVANRQDVFFAYLQLSDSEAPAGLTMLDQWSNALSVRTRIGGYRRLSAAGQATFVYPEVACANEDSLMQAYQAYSPDAHTVTNGYWMWWSNSDAYPGGWGCANVAGLHKTPRAGGAAWVGLRHSTQETVAQSFMHESGHLISGSHGGAAAVQRCSLLGAMPVGVIGPSIMGGTHDRNLRTNCFALTPPYATKLSNMTRVAQYLHTRLK